MSLRSSPNGSIAETTATRSSVLGAGIGLMVAVVDAFVLGAVEPFGIDPVDAVLSDGAGNSMFEMLKTTPSFESSAEFPGDELGRERASATEFAFPST